ncbi:hypothetical protein [Mesorhizobium sp. M0767]|uniref:Acb2/Tad1 domain-containing protein n=1 Tax=Mesorhizobium sp. M0767 TaxID=2956995 RepID=UPI003337CCD5
MKDGLPVAGYRPQNEEAIALVNQNKMIEEALLRQMDAMQPAPNDEVEKRWLAIARTHLEIGFMALNRSIFRPSRIKLPGDPA